jgi:hypothetical protein
MPVILATQEAEIRRIAVWSQPGQKKLGLVEWLKVKALSSSPNTAKQKQNKNKPVLQNITILYNDIMSLCRCPKFSVLLGSIANTYIWPHAGNMWTHLVHGSLLFCWLSSRLPSLSFSREESLHLHYHVLWEQRIMVSWWEEMLYPFRFNAHLSKRNLFNLRHKRCSTVTNQYLISNYLSHKMIGKCTEWIGWCCTLLILKSSSRRIPRWWLEGGSRKCASYSEILERRWRHTLQAKTPRRGKTLTPPHL